MFLLKIVWFGIKQRRKFANLSEKQSILVIRNRQMIIFILSIAKNIEELEACFLIIYMNGVLKIVLRLYAVSAIIIYQYIYLYCYNAVSKFIHKKNAIFKAIAVVVMWNLI